MDNDDIFKKAIAESLNSQVLDDEKARAELVEKVRERVQEGESQWDLLKRMIEGSLTEKFIDVISNMPDRDFVRNYLKMIEHFKPKLTRQEGGLGDDPDMTINIQTMIINEKGEQEIIPLNQVEKNGD